MNNSKKHILVAIIIINANFIIAQNNDSIYNWNVSLITKFRHCDSIRFYPEMFTNVKHNYKKMLRFDKKLINFFNDYETTSPSKNWLLKKIKKFKDYKIDSFLVKDKFIYDVRIVTKGLIELWFQFSYNEKVKRIFYQFQINNKAGSSYSRPLDYHYMVFKRFKFKLGERENCYYFVQDWNRAL